ncbi:tetratricopeptide repeat protein [Anabaena sp. CCY 9402-a]|uniref:tetratricopeptide repeat protein n=1 Tax=Anabaena sp. CCY 9402-a TaxID=3103867 RepID=UPI0039C5BF08
MTSIRRNPSPKLPPELLVGIVIALAITGIPSIVQHFLDQQKYESAMQSYKVAECGSAIEQFNQIISAFRLVDAGDYVSRAEEKKAECEFFEDAVRLQKDGKFELALLSYAKVAVYDNSALLEPTRKKLYELFQKAKVTSLSTLNVCNRIGILAERNLVPKSNANLPPLYLACGEVYDAEKSYKRAIIIYEEFIRLYPDHSLVENVKRSLARTTVADIRGRKGLLNIKSPRQTGTTGDGSTVIEIQNTSPAKMRITFSGTTPKFEEIEECKDCVVYVNNPPKLCPNKGLIGRYTFEPGQYDIAVEFTANDGNPVNPWAGTWLLETGAEYKSCFLIIRDPVDNPKKKEENSP